MDAEQLPGPHGDDPTGLQGTAPLIEELARPSPSRDRHAVFERLADRFENFRASESAGAVVLLITTAIALLWANSPWGHAYEVFWETELRIGTETAGVALTLREWVSDGFMAVFFFTVGLEIKREFLVGELADIRRAALPVAAALGGMVVPAGFYLLLNAGGGNLSGWGVPMATDIAFALGVLGLLGSRVPAALVVFLTALAIVDDIGAVLVIAIFYSADIAWTALAAGGACFLLAVLANAWHARSPTIYAVLGVGAWTAFLLAGVHSTVAGVLLAMTIPARTRIKPDEMLQRGRRLLELFGEADTSRDVLANPQQRRAIAALEQATEHAQTPLQRLERSLDPWVAFLVMPLFALANAGLVLSADLGRALGEPLALGIMAGLVLGKPIGITLFAWAAVRLRLASRPPSVTSGMLAAAGLVAGVGFTMSLLIAQLAFSGPALDQAKAGVLAASVVAGVGGYAALRRATGRVSRRS